jgi:hypothetical protein
MAYKTKSAKMKEYFAQLMYSNNILCFMFGIALINLLIYLQYNYFGSIIIFLIISVIISFFTKNMIIILGGSILMTNILVCLGVLTYFGIKEGLDNIKNPKVKPAKKKLKVNNKIQDNNTKIKPTLPTTPIEKQMSEDDDADDADDADDNANATSISKIKTKSLPAPNQPPSKSGFANFEDDDDDDDETNAIKTKATRYNNNLSNSQENLQQLLGSNGIQNINTTDLLQQQKTLMTAMQGMQPLIDGANGMLTKIGSSPLGKLLGVPSS